MDCFASLAMTTKRDFTFSRRNAPELWEKSLSLERKRAQGMPDARCTRGLVCNVHKEVRTRAYRAAEAIRHSLRNGFTAYIALSPATNSSCHRRQRIKMHRKPGWTRNTSTDLTPATGARTTRFCRTLQHRSSCAPRIAHRPDGLPCDRKRAQRCRVHRIPSRVRDDRDTPLLPE
jgi:hypothetical protein